MLLFIIIIVVVVKTVERQIFCVKLKFAERREPNDRDWSFVGRANAAKLFPPKMSSRTKINANFRLTCTLQITLNPWSSLGSGRR